MRAYGDYILIELLTDDTSDVVQAKVLDSAVQNIYNNSVVLVAYHNIEYCEMLDDEKVFVHRDFVLGVEE